jgi:hypothetical protein
MSSYESHIRGLLKAQMREFLHQLNTDPDRLIDEAEEWKALHPILVAADYERVTRELGQNLGVTDVRVLAATPQAGSVTILVGCDGQSPQYEAGIASALWEYGWSGLTELLPVGTVVFVHCMRDDAEAMRVHFDQLEGR